MEKHDDNEQRNGNSGGSSSNSKGDQKKHDGSKKGDLLRVKKSLQALYMLNSNEEQVTKALAEQAWQNGLNGSIAASGLLLLCLPGKA